jgi:hypothetical protein
MTERGAWPCCVIRLRADVLVSVYRCGMDIVKRNDPRAIGAA